MKSCKYLSISIHMEFSGLSVTAEFHNMGIQCLMQTFLLMQVLVLSFIHPSIHSSSCHKASKTTPVPTLQTPAGELLFVHGDSKWRASWIGTGQRSAFPYSRVVNFPCRRADYRFI
jgi:hypothetical protein